MPTVGLVASILVVLLFFFLGQDLHVCGESVKRREIGVVVAAKSSA
jgi:hypothetical protein